jgi:hypothetical protein
VKPHGKLIAAFALGGIVVALGWAEPALPAANPGTLHTVNTPVPTPRRTPAPLDVPTDLALTQNASTCSKHGGLAGLFCPSALKAGYLVLVWDYPVKSQSAVDGYHVYEVQRGKPSRVDTQQNNQATISFLKPDSDLFGGRCYEVVAFKGSTESKPSKTFCVPQMYEAHTFGGPYWACHQKYANMGSNYHWIGCANSKLLAGYAHKQGGSGANYWNVNAVWRSGVYFSSLQGDLKGLHILRADLAFTMPKGQDQACYGGVGAALEDIGWQVKIGSNGKAHSVDALTTADFSSYTTPAHFGSTLVTIDVTEIVKAWAAGKTHDYGFVLRGTDESLNATNNKQCVLVLNPASELVVWGY